MHNLLLHPDLIKEVHIKCNNLTVYYYHVTYEIQSEYTPYSCLNVKNSLPEIGAISEV